MSAAGFGLSPWQPRDKVAAQTKTLPDLDASVAKAKELGGKICRERVDLPMGSFAMVTDPTGAAFAFWQPSEECPE